MATSGLVFLSYARPDQDRIRPFHQYLQQRGFDVWVDYERLLPGQRWEFELERALARADFVIVFISNNSVDRRGYVQRELKTAIDQSSSKLVDDIYLIPVLLDDDVVIPREIADRQHIAASRPDCWEQLSKAIEDQLARLGVERRATEQREGLAWETHQQKEAWEGLPGYEIALQFIDLKSDRYSGLDEVGAYIKGELLGTLLSFRRQKFEQSPAAYNYGQDRILRTNTHDAVCGTPTLVGQVLSIPYQMMWYGAGAAHPNYGFRVFNFTLNPVALVPSLKELFGDEATALPVVQKCVRQRLYELVDETGTAKLDQSWVDRGTEDWNSFHSYEFNKDGIRLLFPPYQVGAFALGHHTVNVPYKDVVNLLRPDYVSLLSLYRIR